MFKVMTSEASMLWLLAKYAVPILRFLVGAFAGHTLDEIDD